MAEESSCVVVNGWMYSSGETQIFGTLDLISGCIGFNAETTLGDTMQIQWHSMVDNTTSDVNYGGYIKCTDTLHQLCDLEIPEHEKIYVSGESGYYEVVGNLTNNGSLRIMDNSSLYVNNGSTLMNNGLITNWGMLKVQALGIAANSGTITNYGTIQVNEGGSFVNMGSISEDGTITGTITDGTQQVAAQAALVPANEPSSDGEKDAADVPENNTPLDESTSGEEDPLPEDSDDQPDKTDEKGPEEDESVRQDETNTENEVKE